MTAALKASPVELGPHRCEIGRIMHMAGCQAFARGAMQDAERLLARAIQMEPSPEYVQRLGWTIFRNPERTMPQRIKGSQRLLESAAASLPYDAKARYALACWHKEAGNADQWRQELEAVLRCDATHPQAKRELADLHAQEKATEVRKDARRKSHSGLKKLVGFFNRS